MFSPAQIKYRMLSVVYVAFIRNSLWFLPYNSPVVSSFVTNSMPTFQFNNNMPIAVVS